MVLDAKGEDGERPRKGDPGAAQQRRVQMRSAFIVGNTVGRVAVVLQVETSHTCVPGHDGKAACLRILPARQPAGMPLGSAFRGSTRPRDEADTRLIARNQEGHQGPVGPVLQRLVQEEPLRRLPLNWLRTKLPHTKSPAKG